MLRLSRSSSTRVFRLGRFPGTRVLRLGRFPSTRVLRLGRSLGTRVLRLGRFPGTRVLRLGRFPGTCVLRMGRFPGTRVLRPGRSRFHSVQKKKITWVRNGTGNIKWAGECTTQSTQREDDEMETFMMIHFQSMTTQLSSCAVQLINLSAGCE